jgi:hypothetical protein
MSLHASVVYDRSEFGPVGFGMLGPTRATATAWRTGNWLALGRELPASSRVSPMAVQSQVSSVAANAAVGGI